MSWRAGDTPPTLNRAHWTKDQFRLHTTVEADVRKSFPRRPRHSVNGRGGGSKSSWMSSRLPANTVGLAKQLTAGTCSSAPQPRSAQRTDGIRGDPSELGDPKHVFARC